MKNMLKAVLAIGMFFASCAVNCMDNNRDNNRDNRSGSQQTGSVFGIFGEDENGIFLDISVGDILQMLEQLEEEEEEEEWEERIDLQVAEKSCSALIPQITSHLLSATAKPAEKDGNTYKVVPWRIADTVNLFVDELASISDLSFRHTRYRKKVSIKFDQDIIKVISPAIILPNNSDFSKTLYDLAGKYNGFLPYDKVETLLKGESVRNFLLSENVAPYVFPGLLQGEDWIGNEVNDPFCLPGMLIKISSRPPLQLVDKVISLKGMGHAGTYDELAEIAAEFNGDLPVNMLLDNCKTGGISRDEWINLLLENRVLLRNPCGTGPHFIFVENFNIYVKGRPFILVVPDTIALPTDNCVSQALFTKLQALERYENSRIPTVSMDEFSETVLSVVSELRGHVSSEASLIEAAPDFLKTVSMVDIVNKTRQTDIRPILRGQESQFVQFDGHKFQLLNGIQFVPDTEHKEDNTYNLFFPRLKETMHRDLSNIVNRLDAIFDEVKFDPHYKGIPCNMPMYLANWREWECASHEFVIVHPCLLPRSVVALCDGTEVEIESANEERQSVPNSIF